MVKPVAEDEPVCKAEPSWEKIDEWLEDYGLTPLMIRFCNNPCGCMTTYTAIGDKTFYQSSADFGIQRT